MNCNSGYTGSSINAGFIKAKGLNVLYIHYHNLCIPIYNVDRTLNKGGAITDYIILRMTIGTHSEQLTFSVTDLGKSDLFLGHEWLHLHIPSIDWQEVELKFNWCPKAYQLFYFPSELEENPGTVETFPNGEVEEGD